eukprot:TRINITY_DN61_c0_g1_i1.p2 TRINITY_DN61_c0_g1~~TRINITY_DN61_c0_g1_i1.p2  ORF type:complete len:348 (+),score=125.19 TRINITY_DN61_c0_g1_i1:211-1254(+)
MGERKVLNKYYPPDFDFRVLPRAKAAKNDQYKVRMMMPMSVICNNCGEYIYRGKKFNSRKEIVKDEDYLGIKIQRFYMKCSRCSAEFTIKTDPQNADYKSEFNCKRISELWDTKDKGEAKKRKREEDEEGDVMKTLENRAKDSKVEMDIIDALDDLKQLTDQGERADTDEVIRLGKDASSERATIKEQEEEDEKAVKAIKFRAQTLNRLDDVDDGGDGGSGGDDELGGGPSRVAGLFKRPATKRKKTEDKASVTATIDKVVEYDDDSDEEKHDGSKTGEAGLSLIEEIIKDKRDNDDEKKKKTTLKPVFNVKAKVVAKAAEETADDSSDDDGGDWSSNPLASLLGNY